MLDNITTDFENTDREALIRQRYQELARDPIVQSVGQRAYYLPFWMAGGSLLSIFAVNYSHKRVHAVMPTWKYWFWGSIGAVTGLQLGAWDVKRYYDRLDPNRRIIREVNELQTLAYSNPPREAENYRPKKSCPPFGLFSENREPDNDKEKTEKLF
jgi:hypothetical protein